MDEHLSSEVLDIQKRWSHGPAHSLRGDYLVRWKASQLYYGVKSSLIKCWAGCESSALEAGEKPFLEDETCSCVLREWLAWEGMSQFEEAQRPNAQSSLRQEGSSLGRGEGGGGQRRRKGWTRKDLLCYKELPFVLKPTWKLRGFLSRILWLNLHLGEVAWAAIQRRD